MSLLKSTLLGTGILLALATTASAQSFNPNLPDGNVMMLRDGRFQHFGGTKVNAKGHAAFLKHGVELTPGSMVYNWNGRHYLLVNKEDDGMLFSDHAKGWIGD
jgi:hypothetical protein